MMDTNKDGELDTEEFERVMHILFPNILARAVTLFVFILAWPTLITVLYNSATEYLHGLGMGESLPPVLRCLCSVLDDLHIVPTFGALLGFVLLLGKLYACLDALAGRLAKERLRDVVAAQPVKRPKGIFASIAKVVKGVDPRPLLIS